MSIEIMAKILGDDGVFPNNEHLPLLFYKHGIKLSENNPAAEVERVFRKNSWGGSWRNGIYPYHHYHSTAHEVLGIYEGSVTVQLGGPKGLIIEGSAGDVIIIPAGVAHKNLESSTGFRCVGAYPPGQNWDMNFGTLEERTDAIQNISKVLLPETDPVFGKDGPLVKEWK